MESKYQVVSIKENPFQRAGDVTFGGHSPSFTLLDFSFFFLCSFLSPLLPHFFPPFLLSFFLFLRFSGKRVLCSFWIAVWTRARLSRGSELWSSQHRALSLSSGACWTTLTDASAHLEPGWAGSREGELLLHFSPFSVLWTCSNTICPCSKDASLLPSVGNTRQFNLSVGWSRRNVVAQVANLWKINETFRDEMMKCPFLAREALVSNAFINCFLQGQNVIDAHRITQLCGCLLSNS